MRYIINRIFQIESVVSIEQGDPGVTTAERKKQFYYCHECTKKNHLIITTSSQQKIFHTL